MRFISFEEADSLLSWPVIAEAIKAGHSQPKAEIGDLLLQSAPNALLSRGAWIEGLGMALKSMSVFPQNPANDPPMPSIQGGVLLFEDQTGSLEAIIDGVLVTKWKTAGDSVLGASLLARQDSKTHLMVGAGTVAESIIDAYHAIFPDISRFLIWNRTRANADRLAEKLSRDIPGIEVVDSLSDACAEADIITSATMSIDPVLLGDWISPGTHLDLIGAFKPDMREADDDLLLKSSIFVDSRATTIGHIGEIDIPIKAGTISVSDIKGDFYDICAGKAGRNGSEDITFFKNGGGAHLDLMTSRCIFQTIGGK